MSVNNQIPEAEQCNLMAIAKNAVVQSIAQRNVVQARERVKEYYEISPTP